MDQPEVPHPYWALLGLAVFVGAVIWFVIEPSVWIAGLAVCGLVWALAIAYYQPRRDASGE